MTYKDNLLPGIHPMDRLPEIDPFQKKTLEFIRRFRLVEAGDHVLAAVSGGPDSMALLDCLLHLQESLNLKQVTVIHFDHQLRGETSAGDAAFVRAIAEACALPFFAGGDDVRLFQERHGGSLEMAARTCRHKFFMHAVAQCGGSKIAIGHTGDDQAEELLLRLVRGTGPGGLTGMLPGTMNGVIRPLLWAGRGDVLDYLTRQGTHYREDASNQDPFCQRNVLRLKVFPILREHFHESIARTMTRHAELARDEEDWWNIQVENCRQSVQLEEAASRVVLSASAILALHPSLQRRVLRSAIERLKKDLLGIYSVHVELLRDWIANHESGSGKSMQLPGGIYVTAEGGRIAFSQGMSGAPTDVSQQGPLTMRSPGTYDFASFRLDLQLHERSSLPPGMLRPPSADVAWMDARAIDWPMSARFWKPGDRFKPLGSPGTKKLQDYFTDAKIPRPHRNLIPILCDSEKICWIVGQRTDDRVKVTPETRLVLVCEAHAKP